MTQHRWPKVPARIRRQAWNFVEALRQPPAQEPVGVCLHGSLAMGCFNPRTSDLDFLVVVRREMTVETKKWLAELLLRLSGAPAPIEVSVLTAESLEHWRHPAPYEFHFSEDHRAKYDRALRTGEWARWRGPQGEDPDLAANITVARERGVALHGPPAHATPPSVPARDYLAALLTDAAWARERMDREPVYAVLNRCRTLAYLGEKLILSKTEGGRWALGVLPEHYHDLIANALAAYRSDGHLHRLDRAQLRRSLRFRARRSQEAHPEVATCGSRPPR